jgi:hypothetical protein
MNTQLYKPRREAWQAMRRLHDYAQGNLDSELCELVSDVIHKLDNYEIALGFVPGDGRLFFTAGSA